MELSELSAITEPLPLSELSRAQVRELQLALALLGYPLGDIDGRDGTTSYQLRIRRTTAVLRGEAGRSRALMFTVVFDDRDRPRAAYGLVDDPATFAVPIFRRVFERARLFPASVMRGPATLMRAWIRWSIINAAARARGLRVRYRS